jgi:hypothetical protein
MNTATRRSFGWRRRFLPAASGARGCRAADLAPTFTLGGVERRGRHDDRRRADDRRLVVRRGADLDLSEPEQDDRDVVLAARSVGFVDERPRRIGQRLGLAHDLRDALVGSHAMQPIAAQQIHVAGLGGPALVVDLDVVLGPQRSGDDRPLRVAVGLLVGQLAAAYELLDERMVAGQQLERAVAQAVGAAVTDVGQGEAFAVDVGSGQRRPHPGRTLVGLRQRMDLGVGLWTSAARRCSGSTRAVGRPGSSAATAICDATSPACAPPIHRRPRTAASGRNRHPRWHAAGARYRSVDARRLAASRASPRHVRELGLADADAVAVVQRHRTSTVPR